MSDLIYKAKIVCVCVCDMRVRFLLNRPQTRCGCWGQVIAGLTSPVLQFAESYSSISAFSFADNGHYLIIIPINFRLLQDLIRRQPTFEFKPIFIILSCSSNIVAKSIGGAG